MEGVSVRPTMAAAAAATKSVGSAVSPLPAAAAMGERSECPPLPCNAALQREAAVFLAQEHAADASVAARSLTAHSSATGSRRDGNTSFLSELETGGERLSYPPSYFGPTAASSSARREKINPCTCSTAAFDGWLRAVVVSIPGPPDATQPSHGGDFGAARAEGMHSHRASTSQSTLAAAFVEGSSRKASMAAAVVLVSRERALHTALELLETAARLLQRRLALSHGQNSLLQAYYNALEEDIDATTTTGSELKPTAFHRELRSRKREVPLQHYSAEQKELEARLEKLYYVLRKLEEIEGLSNSILVEGREAVQNASAAADTLRPTQKGLHETSGHDAASDAGAPLTGDATADSPTYSFTNAVGGASSRRLVAIERRVRRLRRQLNLPLAPAEITSRLRNELILSFSARVLALREPAPFTPEMHAPKDSDTRNNDSSAMSAPPPSYQHRHAHSISAFVEWYVQHIMDPPAMSQLLSIVPHAYVVTTSCRLVYACEAHASLRASRALPDLGAVLLRAVTEGRADAMAQLVLSSSVSYGSVLTHPLNSPTCFYAGLMGGQLEVVARLVNQQCWDAEALHVLLFIGAPWGRASATRGCYNYQKTMLSRVWRVLQLAERGLQNIEQQQQQQDDDSNAAASSNAVSLNGEHEISTGSDSDVAASAASADKSEDASSGSAAAAVAVAALRDAGLFSTASATSDDVTVLQTFRALFAAAASPFSSAAAQVESQLGSEDGLDGNDDSTAASPMTIHGGTQRSSFHDSDDSAIQAIGSVVSPGVVAPPPVFLDGGLQKLRLLLVARSGTLQYEAQQQDAQWAALLDQSARPVALRRRPSHGVNALAQDDTAARTAAAAAGVAAGDGNSSSISSESVFAAVLRRRQLDSLSPAAACPVRCQMCPAFSTPALQRVDALSYGPLQPTTSARAAAPVNDVVEGLGPVSSEEEEEADCAVDDDPKAASTDLGRAAKADSGGTERTQQQQRPVRALLVRADTAIEGAPHAWYAYWCSASPVVASADHFGEVENGRQSTQDALSVASSRRPWRISFLRLQSRGSSRYSSTHAIEDSIQAALSAKQQRARRTLYGAAAGEVDSMADAKDDGGTGEDEAADEESGIIGASNSDVRGDVLRARSPLTALRGSARLSARSVYFEVHLSLNYLLALHDPAASLASSLVVNAARPVLSANSVVVGLCDDSVAVTANGCTRGPQQPFPVAHLGHSCDPGFVKAAASSEGKGATTTSTLGSAGVSVSVIAHRTRPHYSTEGSKSEEVYLAVSQHQGNSVSVVMADKDTPLYLRMEVPRYNRDAAAALTQAKDYQDGNPNIEMEAVTGALSGSVSVDDDGDAHQSCEATQSSPTYASPAATFLPNITIASPQDVQMAASTTQPSDATWHGLEASSLAVCPATIVMGLLYTPMSDALRLRVNNYVLPDELRLGMAAHASTADTAAASNNRELNNHSSSNSMLRPCLYPAATLSLDEHGWERWYTHQTQMWTRARQQRPGSASAAMLPSAPAVSNAVVRFVFEAAHLLYGPPLTAVPPQGGALTAATSTAAVATRPAAHRRPRGTYVSLLDTACKFTQLLRVLTNVAALAGLTSSQQWQQTNLAATAATTTRHHSSDSDCEEAPPGFGEEGLGLGLAKSKVTSAAVPFFGSRDRLVRDALSGVQALLNAPAAEGALFYPPVRIYRHSSHCPPQDLYPLPPASKISMDGSKERDKVGADGKGTESNTKAEAAAATNLNSTSHASAAKPSPQPMRRQLGAGLAMQTAATSRLSWHEVLPENARLTPLCAALASRQPAMAYAIATHPLTSFCDSGNEAQNRTQQQQQRRTALYAACALGYADVLAVLLERIPVEEILSFFGLVIEGEARAALQQSYAKAEALFLRNYRLNLLSTPVMTVSPSQPRDGAIKGGASNSSHRGGTSTRFASLAPFGAASGCDAAAAASGGGRFYGTNECQRALLDVSSIYSTTRTLYTPLHVALLGVIRTEDDDDDEDEDDGGDDKWSDDSDLSSGWEGSARDAGQQRFDDLPNVSAAYASSVQHLVRGLRRQTACTTLLLNCLYELLLTAPRAATTASGVSSGRVTLAENAAAVGRRPASPGCNGLGEDFATIGSPSDSNYEHAGTPTTTRYTEAGAELLASALNQQSRAGETALLLAVRHNNCRVATRLLRLGAQAACMDRVTHLFALELACANRCSPMAEALLRGPSSPYATSPVLLNHAGIATPLCWCAINNMHTVLQTLLRCDGVDVSAGFEGSTPLQLAITFGSEEAALALLSGTQPKTAAASTGDGTDRPKSHRAANVKGNDASNGGNSDNGGALQRSPPTAALPASTHLHQATNDNSSTTTADVAANEKPFMDVNVPHERTRCTALHLACERGQLHVVRALLQQWHAQLNVAAASTNYTPLLSALANGREDAALRILEYSKDELRRGRAVLDLTAIDQNGDTALHLAARHGLVLATEYMLAQFCEEEVTRLAQLHPQLRASPAFFTATCMVPLYAVNKQSKSALLVAIQYEQADAAEVLVSTFMDRQDGDDNVDNPDGDADDFIGRDEARKQGTSEGEENARANSRLRAHAESTTSSSVVQSAFAGPLIDGTCMALHQAFKKRLYTLVDLMLSAPTAARVFPASQAFRDAVQRRNEERRGNRVGLTRFGIGSDNNNRAEEDTDAQHSSAAAKVCAAGQNRSSFVRLLLTRAAGPAISPGAALRLLFRGFVLPELCVYLSDVAAESAVLGVQHGTAMAHAELLMGYLQEHARLVVAPTRMVSFCRDVWGCLQTWMRERAAQGQTQPQRQHPRGVEAETKKRKSIVSFHGGPTSTRCGTASPSTALRQRAEVKEEERRQEAPMVWLCCALLPTTATAASPESLRGCSAAASTATATATAAATAKSTTASLNAATSLASGEATTQSTDAARDRERRRKSEEVEAKKYGVALRSALDRKSLSLDVARAIRLYGSSAGGARAIEEIEGLVREFVTAKANAQARQMRQRLTSRTQPTTSPPPRTGVASKQSDTDREDGRSGRNEGDEEYAEAAFATACEPSALGSSLTDAATMMAVDEADVLKEVVGNEVLFTTPIGFTVLQLAAALGLSEVTAFLVERYHLDPLYAPSQDFYADAEIAATAEVTKSNNNNNNSSSGAGMPQARVSTRASLVASASLPRHASLHAAMATAAIAASGRDEEEEQLRVLNGYTVRAMVRVVNASFAAGSARVSDTATSGKSSTRCASQPLVGYGDDGNGDGGGGNGSSWFYWTPYRLAVRTGNVDVVRMLLRTADGGGLLEEKRSAASLLDRTEQEDDAGRDAGAEGGDASRFCSHRGRIVDFKEPQWVDPFQRTALQEQIAIVARSASSPSASYSSSMLGGSTGNDNNSQFASGPSGPAGAAAAESQTHGRATSTLAAVADMVALLLLYGAQPNGLFDIAGNDAWMLALTGSGAGGFIRAVASTGNDREGNRKIDALPSGGSGVESSLGLLLRFHTPLLGRAPTLTGKAPPSRGASLDAATHMSDSTLDEQLLRQRRTLLRKWKQLPCMRSSNNSATREKLALMKRRLVDAAEAAALDSVDEGGFVFDAAEALSEAYSKASPQETVSGPPSHVASSELEDFSTSNLHEPALTSFVSFSQRNSEAVVAAAGDNSSGAGRLLSPPEQAMSSSLLWRGGGGNPLSDGVPSQVRQADSETCKKKLVAALRLCYRVVLLFLCLDHAPQQLLRLLRVYTPDVIPVRARHPFSGDTVVTRLLRNARERLLTSGDTPTETEVSDMMSRVIDGVRQPNPCERGNPAHQTSADAAAAGQAFAPPDSWQRTYREATEDLGALTFIHTSLALIHFLRRLGNDGNGPTAASSAALECTTLQPLLFQPSFDGETPLSLAARLADVPLISAIVQSAAPPMTVDATADAQVNGNNERSNRSSHGSRQPSQETHDQEAAAAGDELVTTTSLSATSSAAAAAEAAASQSSSPPPCFSLTTNLTDVVVRVLLATRVYYPAHEIATVRILLHCMPNEAARLDFLRWVYPNIHPLPALQLAMDHVSVAAHFLTTAECMNALWTNLLYTRFTRQLDTAVRASSKAWNTLLKVVLPGAPAVPIYLILRGALRAKSDDAEGRFRLTEPEAGTTATAKPRDGRQSKNATLTNWSYLVRRTTIFLQLMSMNAAEALMSKLAGTSHAGSSLTSHLSLNMEAVIGGGGVGGGGGGGVGGVRQPLSNRSPLLGRINVAVEGSDAGAAGGSVGGSSGTPRPTCGLAGTLLLDTLELSVRYDDKEVLSLLMQLRIPEVVTHYVHQVQLQQQQQQQQAAGGSAFPVSFGVQSTNARAIEAANTAILNSYPSFAGVRSMEQAVAVLDRLQLLLWREAIEERHLDLVAVLAGAARTLRSLYTSRQANVASLLTPMRYDRIDVKTGNPEGVISAMPIPQQQRQQQQPSSSMLLISPQCSPGTETLASVSPAVSPVEHLDATTNVKRFPHSTSSLIMVQRTPSESRTPSPPLAAAKTTPRSVAQQEDEEEQRFMDSCLHNGRLAPREERRRRVTLVTWGIGGSSCPVELPAGRGSTSAAAVDGALSQRNAEEKQQEDEGEADAEAAETTGAQEAVKCTTGGDDGGALARVSPPASLLSPAPPGLPPASLAASTALRDSDNVKKTSTSQQQPRKIGVVAQPHTTASSKALVPTLHLPAAQPAASPRPAVDPVYFMYLQLDWAMFSTRLLQSPQPSTATIDTILFLLEHRCALSVPVLDLFLSGLIVTASRFVVDASPHAATPDHEDPARPRSNTATFSEAGEDAQTVTVELSLRYRTRHHRDTLLHLLVLHDQCQLAEYYLEYCYLFFVSHQIDPAPKNGRPGRFPIHELLPLRRQSAGYTRVSNSSNSNDAAAAFPSTPVAFLRTMLRVNAHGLAAFDYAHSPAMLQLLEWYGCVPPTYRPNPRLFRQVLLSGARSGGKSSSGRHHASSSSSEPGSAEEVTGWAFVADDSENDEDWEGRPHHESHDNSIFGLEEGHDASDEGDSRQQQQQLGSGLPCRKKREVLRFFPVPRLVLATDNFITLLDPTGAELASTVPQALLPSGRCSAGTTTAAGAVAARQERDDVDGKDGDDGPRNALQDQRPGRQQLRAQRHLAALITAEKKQLQLAWRRREQREAAKALLFEQVAMQPLLAARPSGTGSTAGKKGKSNQGTRGPANPPYLNPVITANLRQMWEAQRRPHISDNVLWHNALEAQRQSSLAVAARFGGGSGRLGRDDSRRGGAGGVLPILLSEEVSLLHLGLCAFDDELVSLYGELHASPHQSEKAFHSPGGFSGGDCDGLGGPGGDKDGTQTPRPTTRAAAVNAIEASAPQAQLSAYNRMLLPPVLTGKATQLEQLGQTPKSTSSAKKQDAQRAKLGRHDAKLSISGLVTPMSTAAVAGGGSGAAVHGTCSTFSPAAAAPPPPPRLSHADVVFLLECQQFVVFPLALPSVVVDDDDNDDAPLEDGSRNADGSAMAAAAAAAAGVTGREAENQRGGLPVSYHGPHNAMAVIDRCTGGGGDVGRPGNARRRSRARSSTAASATAPSQPRPRGRSRAEAQQGPASDAPLLRAMLARQAATMYDLVDVTSRRYDTALLVSLTPMQLSGVVGNASGGGAGGKRGGSSTTMRALVERLASTQFKQFGSRLVSTASTGASLSSASSAAVTAAAHTTVETVALLCVPPFAATDTSALLPPTQRIAAGATAAPPSHQDTINQWGDAAATTTTTATAATTPALPNMPTVMAARLEEWVTRHWTAQRRQPPKPKAEKKAEPAGEDGSSVGVHDLSLFPMLDRVAPVGGVATATQQTLMRALLRHFSVATGAQLSEQVGLSVAPNYDVAEVGDAAAARRDMATKGTASLSKKRR